MKKDKIYITGFMGSGKSTIGKLLAHDLGYEFIDSDDQIEHIYKKSVKQIFADEGEAWFRNLEESMIEDLVKLSGPLVVSLGGGALMSEKNLANVLADGLLVYIKSSPEKIYSRIKHSRRRPLLSKNNRPLNQAEYLERITGLLARREPGYASAHLIFDRDSYEKEECAGQLALQIKKITEQQPE